MTCHTDSSARYDLTSFEIDWKRRTGTWVEVHHNGTFVRAGILDEIMADGGIFWLASNGVERRALFDTDSGYRIHPPS